MTRLRQEVRSWRVAVPEVGALLSPHPPPMLWLQQRRLRAVIGPAVLCRFNQAFGSVTTREKTHLPLGPGGQELACQTPRAERKPVPEGRGRGQAGEAAQAPSTPFLLLSE